MRPIILTDAICNFYTCIPCTEYYLVYIVSGAEEKNPDLPHAGRIIQCIFLRTIIIVHNRRGSTRSPPTNYCYFKTYFYFWGEREQANLLHRVKICVREYFISVLLYILYNWMIYGLDCNYINGLFTSNINLQYSLPPFVL